MKSVSVLAGEWMNFRLTVFHSAKPKHNQSWVDGIREDLFRHLFNCILSVLRAICWTVSSWLISNV